jgi:hypothetical protein
VDDGARVRLVERHARLPHVGHDLVGRQALEPLQALRELLAAQELHDHEGHLRRRVDARVEDLDDELALDVGRDAGLALEPGPEVVVVQDVGQHHLERAPPVRLDVDDLVDGAHAARGDAPDDPVPLREERAVDQRGGHDPPPR